MLKLEIFEKAEDFEECLDEAVDLIKRAIKLGGERHGDSFVEAGLPGFANHCQRKSRDQARIVLEGVDVGCSLDEVQLDLAAFVLLERAYFVMAERRLKAQLGELESTGPQQLKLL
jgi:hypothetical protein